MSQKGEGTKEDTREKPIKGSPAQYCGPYYALAVLHATPEGVRLACLPQSGHLGDLRGRAG